MSERSTRAGRRVSAIRSIFTLSVAVGLAVTMATGASAHTVNAPAPDAITIQALTQPYAVAVVKRSSLPVRFVPVGAASLRSKR